MLSTVAFNLNLRRYDEAVRECDVVEKAKGPPLTHPPAAPGEREVFPPTKVHSHKISLIDIKDDSIDAVISHIVNQPISHMDIVDDHINIVDDHIDIPYPISI
jgi:hypothetical protein